MCVHRTNLGVYDVGNPPTLLGSFERMATRDEQEQRTPNLSIHAPCNTTVVQDRNRGSPFARKALSYARSVLIHHGIGWTLALVFGLGCEFSKDLPTWNEPPSPPQAPKISENSTLPSASAQTPSKRSPETLRAIATLRNATLRFTPRETPPQRLTFFGNHLARLTRSELYLAIFTQSQSAYQTEIKRHAIASARELTRLADDSLLVMSAKATLIFDADGRPQNSPGKIVYFPGTFLFPELRFPKAFFTFEPNHGIFSLFRWDQSKEHIKNTSSAILFPDKELELPNLIESLCGQLLDGSIACVREQTLYTVWPGFPEKRHGLLNPGATIVRILPGNRLDRVRLLRSDGRLEEYWVAEKPKMMATLSLPWVPFDVARNEDAVAVLQLEQDTPQQLKFSLVVVDNKGTVRFKAPLGTVPTPSDSADFDREVLSCRSLATHPRKPWIAVSDCHSVSVFDSKTGSLLAKIQDVRF
jgi:hypothetical protein